MSVSWAGFQGLAVFICGFLLFVACNRMGIAKSKGEIRMMDPKEAVGMVANDFAVIVDVREEDEVRSSGMAAQAQWIPMSKIKGNDKQWLDFLSGVSKDKTLIFYCAAGGRAGKVASEVAAKGFKAGNMGGFKDWVAAGLPTKKIQ